ncbi:hypothetical protein [Streptomyces sp. cmx-4-9]|uniref:hypothetical protein n=1 Tax=Streptomyces sp. cmx-4-9 TaxID=2790941 RepID=UPI0039800D31
MPHTPESRLRIAARFREIAADLEMRGVGNRQDRVAYFNRRADELEQAGRTQR